MTNKLENHIINNFSTEDLEEALEELPKIHDGLVPGIIGKGSVYYGIIAISAEIKRRESEEPWSLDTPTNPGLYWAYKKGYCASKRDAIIFAVYRASLGGNRYKALETGMEIWDAPKRGAYAWKKIDKPSPDEAWEALNSET